MILITGEEKFCNYHSKIEHLYKNLKRFFFPQIDYGKEDNSLPILEILDDDYLSSAETISTISDCSEPAYRCFLEGKSTTT